MQRDAGEQDTLGNYAETHLYMAVDWFKGELYLARKKKKVFFRRWKQLEVVKS